MYRYRIFLSYCKEDQDHANHLVEVLSDMGLEVFWDHKLTPGNPFTPEIKTKIGRSHLFVVLLTQASKERPWVHQETGYAMGVGVPILPIAVDDTYPDALIKELQAQRLDPSSIDAARDLLATTIEKRVRSRYSYEAENYTLAQSQERRMECLVKFAEEASELGGGRVRQRAALTSFHLPTSRPIENLKTDIWKRRDGCQERSPHLHEQLFKERHALDALAKKDGCTLIMAPSIRLDKYGDEALLLRQKQLLAFLRDEVMHDVKPIVLSEPEHQNILIVGDWFYAESRDPGRKSNYKHTFFTWHAPTVLEKIEEFDSSFESIREHEGIDPRLLRQSAQEQLQKIIKATEERIAKERT
jgi:hypothetical protein